MGEEWAQCQVCGHLHQVKMRDISEDDLYIEERCPKCRDGTKHLWCGDSKEDVYIYYNANLDSRYF